MAQAFRSGAGSKLKAYGLYLIGRSSEELERFEVALGLYHEIISDYPFERGLIFAAGKRLQNQSLHRLSKP